MPRSGPVTPLGGHQGCSCLFTTAGLHTRLGLPLPSPHSQKPAEHGTVKQFYASCLNLNACTLKLPFLSKNKKNLLPFTCSCAPIDFSESRALYLKKEKKRFPTLANKINIRFSRAGKEYKNGRHAIHRSKCKRNPERSEKTKRHAKQKQEREVAGSPS